MKKKTVNILNTFFKYICYNGDSLTLNELYSGETITDFLVINWTGIVRMICISFSVICNYVEIGNEVG